MYPKNLISNQHIIFRATRLPLLNDSTHTKYTFTTCCSRLCVVPEHAIIPSDRDFYHAVVLGQCQHLPGGFTHHTPAGVAQITLEVQIRCPMGGDYFPATIP